MRKTLEKFHMLHCRVSAPRFWSFFKDFSIQIGNHGRFQNTAQGFTLIETLVAISLLVVAIAAPMSLAAQSLSSAFYARDQVTAFHLAQEAIEAVRSVRDHNLLISIAGTQTSFLDGVPNTVGQPFTIDTRDNSMVLCPSGTCPVLRNDGNLYGYAITPGWKDTRFTRIVRVTMVGGSTYEAKIAVEVRWRSGAFQERNFTINENLYEWVSAGGL